VGLGGCKVREGGGDGGVGQLCRALPYDAQQSCLVCRVF
jgi:hypothetical protein